jgi:uncharacterized protein DUF402
MTWRHGSHVVIRSCPGGEIGYCFPAIVLRDTPAIVALFQPAGTVCKTRGGPRGGPGGRHLLEWDGTHRDVEFTRSTVHVHVPGDSFWVIREWDGDACVGWYINLSAPWVRTQVGFDTEDHTLDIEVADDMSAWWWKDEDGLARMIEHQPYSHGK